MNDRRFTPDTPTEGLIQFLANGDEAYANLLQQCDRVHLDIESNSLLVDCNSSDLADEILAYLDKNKHLAKPAIGLASPAFNLRIQGESAYNFSPHLLLRYPSMLSLNNEIITIPDFKAFELFVQNSSSLKLTRMKDNKGLLCGTDTRDSSGVNPPDWIGRNQSQGWHPDDFQNFLMQIERHNHLREFSYRAEFFPEAEAGGMHRFTVNAQLVAWFDQTCRLIEVLDCRPC